MTGNQQPCGTFYQLELKFHLLITDAGTQREVHTAADIGRYYSYAFALAIFTIVYNGAEGIIATWFGAEDETFALFGFGLDSFVEILSGVGVAHMIVRLRKNPNVRRDNFERTALRVTGTAFYILTGGLIISSCFSIVLQHTPKTTFWGLVISIISIAVMMALMSGKIHVGKKLNSPAILADARCTRVCVYMSVILLVASGLYELTHLPYIDAAGTLGLAYFSFGEGKECFEKASTDNCCSC